MSVHESNQVQAEFWTTAGRTWVERRDRFDAQAGAHGLAAIDALDPQPGERFIDIGCGAGTSTLQIAERVGSTGSVHGLDISPTMIEGASRIAADQGIANVSFAVGDAMAEHFDGDADAVYSRFGVMFFSDATAAFSNILTALRPGGRLGFVCWQAPPLNPWMSRSMETARKYVDIPFGTDPTAPGPFSLADPERIGSVLGDAGFTGLQVNPRDGRSILGATPADAVDFMVAIMPAAAALAATDPDQAAALRADLGAIYQDWMGPDGVASPSATWIVTARRP